MEKVNLFNIDFDNFSFDDLSSYIKEAIYNREPRYIVTCNVDHIIKLTKEEEFLNVYNKADAVVADGVPVVWASKLLKKPLKQKVSGSDIIPMLGKDFEKNKFKLFFLGAAEGVAEQAKKNLEIEFPGLEVVGCYSPSYGFEKNESENIEIIRMIKAANPDILFVGVGAPKQEVWINKYYKEYNVPVSIGVGATFDFLAGNVKRAPIILQNIGLEWAWRLCQEPKRLWKRYLVDDSKFLLLLFKELKKSKA
ncbi:WecB/TagA/CpsF family glycosyltransferase [Niallia taxi]|uniref:WecB/TagA/CpsF family glycosyltransferase n=1 Tax=Niallia taxi TaxID=2499688 RepID=UPI003D2C9409